MKKVFLTPLLVLLTVAAVSQSLEYHIRGVRYQAIKKEKLATIESVNEIIPEYPAGWFNKQTSVELQVTCNGKLIKSEVTGETLSAAQKMMMLSVDAGTDILVTFKGNYSAIQYSTRAVPETEAEYPGGLQQVNRYLLEVMNKTTEAKAPDRLSTNVRVAFTITEEGKISNARISGTPANPETEQLLLEAIHLMPGWKPAKDSKGVNIKQEFEFFLGQGRGGC
jgi:hypothetical protein